MLKPVKIWCEDNFFIVKNPSNTFSNIFYVFAACYIHKNDPMLAFFTFMTGLFSAFYHCFDIVLYQIYDFAGIYLIVLHLIWKYQNKPHDVSFVASNCLLNVMSAVSLNHPDIKFLPQSTTVVLILYVLYLEKNKLNLKFILSGFFLIIAAMCSLIDVHRIYCIPTSFIQFHSLWHFFSSISLVLIHTRFNHLF